MAPPRATRARKAVVDSDEDEHALPVRMTRNASIPSRTRTSQQDTKPSARRAPSAGDRTRESSAASTPPKKPKTLFSFFNNATTQQQQRPQQAPEQQKLSLRSGSVKIEDDIHEEIDDSILDAISDDDEYGSRALALQARTVSGSKRTGDDTVGTTTKFIKISDGSRAHAYGEPTIVPAEDLAWTEKYAPAKAEELAVHKRKIDDVCQWLRDVLYGSHFQRLLVLKGPAGSGKTSTVRLLAKMLQCDVSEWRSVGGDDFTSQAYVSLAAQFDDFLNRGSKYTGLNFVDSTGQAVDTGRLEDAPSIQGQILLIEEFPNLAARTYSTLSSFRSSIMQYLAAHVRFPSAARGQPPQKSPPLVMIISESVLSSSTSSAENFTAHRLLGAEILHHPGTRVIEFNPIAVTFMTKALNAIASRHTRETGQPCVATPSIIAKLSQLGDIRNATSTLQYLQSHASSMAPLLEQASSKSSKAKAKAKGKQKPALPADSEEALLNALSLREGNLGLFHAVGKVVHNKRHPPLPHDQPAGSKGPSEVDVETLQSTTGTDISTFLSGIHENYILSCGTDDTEAVLDRVIGCLDYLGDADIMAPVDGTRRGFYSAGEGLRQEELAFYTAVSGVLHSLPYPVKRESASARGAVSDAKRRAEANQMFFPTEIKLWSRRQEMKGTLEYLSKASGVVEKEFAPLLPISYKQVSQPGRMPMATVGQEKSDVAGALSGLSQRYELLLERLPYLAKVIKRPPAMSALVGDVLKITTFKGYGRVDNDEDDDDPLESARGVFGNQGRPKALAKRNDALTVEKLVLSDDDIEDD